VTDRAHRIGSLVMSRETAQGLDAGDVGIVEAVRRQRTTTGTTVAATIRIGQRQVEVQNPAATLQPARIEAYDVKVSRIDPGAGLSRPPSSSPPGASVTTRRCAARATLH
jgi:hypothetical protein